MDGGRYARSHEGLAGTPDQHRTPDQGGPDGRARPVEGTSGDRALAGIFILRVESMEAAKAAVEKDPAVTAGRFVYNRALVGARVAAILIEGLKVGLHAKGRPRD